MTADPETGDRVINIRRPYLHLIREGRKTTEVRVGYASMRKITPGQVLRFACEDEFVRTRVTAVCEYPSFEAMLDSEDNAAIGAAGMTRDDLLAACRDIYPPEKEALGVLAIHLAPIQADAGQRRR
ncbi:ASCH domain-containing protein [Streptomyces sp. ET3-23]|uniref:ASCH domain-containing protein n=1 Tax=Streptomyces sp. ET3-23 TaxID=2885643 RepID=UPI001D1047E0|nr:ASCH domain-containing protein [Streptomyces sp. ET3-23]MCC2277908.1 ASCH domain-containing protein [Streptomyces sp. ET3-23]